MSDSKLNLVVRFTGIDGLSGALKNIIGLGRSGDQAMRGLRRETRDLNVELRRTERALAEGLRSGAGNLEQLIAEQKRLKGAIADTNRQIERQKRINAIDGRTAKIKARGQELKSSGQQNVVGGATLLTPFVLAGKAAMDFSSGMVDIQQKAELTNAETAQMARNILKAARAAHQLPEDLRAGVDTLAGLGLDPRQAVRMIGPIGRLGTAFKVDLADGANAAFANLNNLKVPIAQTTAALDIMAASGNAGAFEVRDMARWFPALTAQMQALGQKGTPAVADLAAALQIARRGTGDADTAANNVQNLLTKIQAPATIRAFSKNFGVDLPAALKRAYAEGKTPLEAIAELTKKVTGGDLSKLGFAFEDMQAQGALRALIQNLDDYRKIRGQVAQGGGTVARAFGQREAQDAAVAWTSFKGSVSTLAITLGTTVLPVATQFFGHVNSIVGAVGRWAQANPQAARTLISLVAGFAAAKVGLGVLQFAFGSILGPMAKVWGWWSKFRALGSIGAAFPAAAKAFGVLRTAALFLGQGLMRAGMMMLANPMVLAIVAIVAVVGVAAYLIYTHWGRIKSAFAGGVAMLGQAVAWVRDKIVRFPLLFGPLGLVAAFVITHWSQIKAAFWAGIGMIQGVWATIHARFSAGVALVKSALAGLPGWLAGIGRNMMAGLLGALNPAALASRLLSVARNGIAAFKNFLGIKSPSRLFMAMGGHLTSGLALGVDQGARHPLRAMTRLAGGVLAAGSLSLAPLASGAAASQAPAGGSAPQILAPIADRFARAGSAQLAPRAERPRGPGPAASAAPFEIHIHQQPGEDAEALAERVMRKLEQRQRRGQLSSYKDDF